MSAGDNGPGWWYFQARQGYKVVLDLPTSQKGFRREFAFVYFGGDWGIPTVRPDVEPNHELNFRVPEMSEEEAIAAIYLQTEAQIVRGGGLCSQQLDSELPPIQERASSVGSCSLTRLLESDPDMAEKLNYAAMRAAQLKAELKAKKIGVPNPPKKVAKTKKALAKTQDEKAKKAKSVEVNSPRPEERADRSEGTRISVHSEDFRPVRSPQYTPATPRPHDDPEELNLALAKPFAELDAHGLDTRWMNAVECLYSPTDREYIAQSSGPEETNDLFRSWVEFSARLVNVARNKVRLADKVSDLEARGKKHYEELRAAKEGQRIAEADLVNAKRCIDRDQEDFKAERVQWDLAKQNLIKERDEAVIAKTAAEARVVEAEGKITELRFQLAELEKAPKTEDQWFVGWKETKACADFVNEVGSTAQKMGVDDALKRMKAALARSHPSLPWSEVKGSYDALLKEEDQALLAELHIALSDEDDDEDDGEEAEVAEEQDQGVARSEDHHGSTNDQTDLPAA
ncbi:uncharacterized protein LOC125493659 [Beta vulgaris subsp. vulgaris]|uniref:uncharacterized protein LOC125493659 n=1 Tax=Beta vulgaris subsp. vulgaris TaxID=3555 RepID=UPI002546CE86|nr:uncharacterized protein LOC125493659 [Beta vulgaris subsp. vulgaris]